MITRYKDFLNENNTVEGITTEELELLKKYKIKNYSFNKETGRIDVDGDVDFSNKKLKELPKIRFGTIKGDFDCYNNQLTNLRNCPLRVGGSFYCSENQLTSLQYCPSRVGGNFNCNANLLTDLKYCPSEIGGDFSCGYNKLTSLQYCPSEIGGDFSCSRNKLTSLQYCPTIVGGGFSCRNNQLSSLQYCPSNVGSNFYCSDNKLGSIEDYPLSIINSEITDLFHFPDILDIVKINPERYNQFIENGDKIGFHQQIMRDDPSMIQYYIGTSIPIPKKSTFI